MGLKFPKNLLFLSFGPFLKGTPAWRLNIFYLLSLLPPFIIELTSQPISSLRQLSYFIVFAFLPLIFQPKDFLENFKELSWLAAPWPLLIWSHWPPAALALGAFCSSLLAVQPLFFKWPKSPALWGLCCALLMQMFYPQDGIIFWPPLKICALAPALFLVIFKNSFAKNFGLVFGPVLLSCTIFLLFTDAWPTAQIMFGQGLLSFIILSAQPFYSRKKVAYLLYGLAASISLLLFFLNEFYMALFWLLLNTVTWRQQEQLKQTPQLLPSIAENKAFVARLKCQHQGTAHLAAHYAGGSSCRLAHNLDDGFYLCRRACLNLGDCLAACPQKAISRLAQTGFITINENLCLGCGHCLAACPRQLIVLDLRGFGVSINCSSQSGLKEAALLCAYPCLGCGRCRKACPAGAISRQKNLGAYSIDKKICQAYGPSCQKACLSTECPAFLEILKG